MEALDQCSVVFSLTHTLNDFLDVSEDFINLSFFRVALLFEVASDFDDMKMNQFRVTLTVTC